MEIRRCGIYYKINFSCGLRKKYEISVGETEARCVRKMGHIVLCFFAAFVSVGDYVCGGLHYDPKMYMIEKKLQEDL